MTERGQAIPILSCENRLGEEPVWHSQTQTLYWVDTIRPGKIFSYCLQSQKSQSWTFDHPVLALALHAAGGLLIAGKKTVWLWSPKTLTKVPYTTIETDLPENRINCMAADPLGNLWVATMQNNVTDTGEPLEITGFFGSLYRVATNGAPMKLASDYACPNTMLWSPKGKYFYFADSGTGWIYRYVCDLETGQLSEREEFFCSGDNGIPDGSALDEQGYLWNARWGGNCVLRVSPTGELVQKLHMDAQQPTCCVFGGAHQNTLYITSARFGIKTSQIRPNDGALFAYKTKVGGRPASQVKG